MTTTQKVMSKKMTYEDVYVVIETTDGDSDVLIVCKDHTKAKSYIEKQIYSYMKENPIDKNDGGKYIVNFGTKNCQLRRHYFMEINKIDTAWDKTVLKYKIVRTDFTSE